MNVLLTNDDGYQADGLNFLKEYFEKRGDTVFVVAPDGERSGYSHSITLKDAIHLKKQYDNVWALNGTPADCVQLALLGMVPGHIDVVVSGVNHGPNIGKDVIYSGTVGGARQGGLHDIPSFAMSSNAWNADINFEPITWFLNNCFDQLIPQYDGTFFYNINFPNKPLKEIQGITKSTLCNNHWYTDTLHHYDSPHQGRFFWIGADEPRFEQHEGTDAETIVNDKITVSAINNLPGSRNFSLSDQQPF
jgi:5'-nucleotidase